MTLARNILWNFLAFIWLSLLVIVVTPYMVRHMGLAAFGVWAVIMALNVYLTAMDFGIGNALIRFMARANEQGDQARVESYIRSGVAMQAGLGAFFSLALFAASGLIVRWMQVPADLESEARAAFRLSSPAVLFGFLGVAYIAVPA